MNPGLEIRTISGEGPPVKAKELGAVACALVNGVRYASDRPFVNTIDAEGKETFVWAFDGSDKIDFSPSFVAETISFAELQKRFADKEWCKANSDHPIAYMHCMWEQILHLRSELAGRMPHQKITKTNTDDEGSVTSSVVLIPHGASDEDKAEWLEKFHGL